MPEILHLNNQNLELKVWKIKENIDFFVRKLPADLAELPSQIETRNLEWLASRFLLSQLVNQPIVRKTETRKPVMMNDDRYISISHTFDIASVMVCTHTCGVDIEKDLPRIRTIEKKFVSESDLNTIEKSDYQLKLYQIWCAKEAMYKAYGFGGIDFRQHLFVDLETLIKGEDSFDGELIKDDVHLRFKLKYISLNKEYHLVYAIQQ